MAKSEGLELSAPGLMSFNKLLPLILPLEIQSSRPRLFSSSPSLLSPGVEIVLRVAAFESEFSGIWIGEDDESD